MNGWIRGSVSVRMTGGFTRRVLVMVEPREWVQVSGGELEGENRVSWF